MVIYTRVDPSTVAALDELCEAMLPRPTRAQLIDVALAEYVERRRKPNANRRRKGGH
jgi:predicted transcriptional regulator